MNKKIPAPVRTGINDQNTNSIKSIRLKKGTKRFRILYAFLQCPSLTFQTARELGDSCLNTTVSEIQRYLGIQIHREYVTVTGWGGNPTTCCEYRLLEPEKVKARELVRQAIETAEAREVAQ